MEKICKICPRVIDDLIEKVARQKYELHLKDWLNHEKDRHIHTNVGNSDDAHNHCRSY